MTLLSLVAALLVLVLFYLMTSLKMVRQGYQYTIEHFGRFTTVARPGLNLYPAFYGCYRSCSTTLQHISLSTRPNVHSPFVGPVCFWFKQIFIGAGQFVCG